MRVDGRAWERPRQATRAQVHKSTQRKRARVPRIDVMNNSRSTGAAVTDATPWRLSGAKEATKPPSSWSRSS